MPNTPTPHRLACPSIATPFFCGWLVVVISMSVAFLASATGQILIGIMLKPMSEELGWNRSMTAAAITLGTICGGLMSPVTGLLASRFGARVC